MTRRDPEYCTRELWRCELQVNECGHSSSREISDRLLISNFISNSFKNSSCSRDIFCDVSLDLRPRANATPRPENLHSNPSFKKNEQSISYPRLQSYLFKTRDLNHSESRC